MKFRRQFALGTAQIGLNYGVANRQGKPDEATALDILRAAGHQGVSWFDSAQAYGDSEGLIGKFRNAYPDEARLVKIATKIGDCNKISSAELLFMIERSLERLGCSKLDLLMLHDEESIDQSDFLELLKEQVQAKRISRVGVSIYSPHYASEALENPLINVIQVPLNLFDYRLINCDFFNHAHQCKKSVFTRSIYLQGLLLMDPNLAPKVVGAKDAIKQIDTFCREHSLERDLFCIAWASYHAPHAIPIMGADNVDQVKRNAKLLDLVSTVSPRIIQQWDQSVSLPHPDLIHPPAW